MQYVRKENATAIAQSLTKYKLKQWGFVIFRCTYGSQEKWDRLVALVKQHAREYFEVREMPEVYEKMVWTIVEDPATLDGASIEETSKRFSEWVSGDEGRLEREGSAFAGTWIYCPRYSFYLHVDDESLESMAGEGKAWRADGDCLKVVRADMVLAREERVRAGLEEDEEEELDEHELLDLVKKVKFDEIVRLYATLLSIDMWYNILTEDGVCQV